MYILEAWMHQFRLAPELSLRLRVVAERSPFDYTDTDLYMLCTDAMFSAMSR